MSADLVQSLTVVVQRLVLLASEDAELRTHLRKLAQAILEETDASEPSQTDSLLSDAQEAGATYTNNNPALTDSVVASNIIDEAPLPELMLGRSRMTPIESVPPPALPSSLGSAEIDLSIVEARCRIKAEGARWATDRQRLIAEGAAFSTEIEPRDKDIVSTAKTLPKCFLWMCHPTGPSSSNPSLYADVAGCFEAVADVVSVLLQIEHEKESYRSHFKKCLDLLAEAQSALRVAVAAIEGPIDQDQLAVFRISRHMRIDDPADPSEFENLSSRIEAIETLIQTARTRTKNNRKRVGKVRHKASLITSEEGIVADHWRILIATVGELVNDGLPPSNRELREALIPVIDGLPDELDLPAEFQLVLREIDRFIASNAIPITKNNAQPVDSGQELSHFSGMARGG